MRDVNSACAAASLPLAQKLDYLRARGGPDGAEPPSDRHIADAVNKAAGETVVSHVTLGKLRKGEQVATTDARLAALAEYFGVDPLFLQRSREEIVDEIALRLRYLIALHSGDITGTGRLSSSHADLVEFVERAVRERQAGEDR
ncbi:hypothetical protein J7W19_25890 [Streptomyces mobaraensis NBRC 13819 = DSM 40847]|uniref:Uncharacterized protein n=1 Tax=Streptomyces mobaraensis TaxID=35621 RepID=A0A5N5W892_STRMB|nr:hypothetical protein [Streptomyces mobaraensis]KAB7843732.1 hypothetical protein FRZ00_17415 [Streptomyces mobaraensis]QTT76355.1 hypothetical protein J7W19_25890 [Streptomyces mobaraensis NBRC 13819 = DSM 40847]